MTQSEFFPASSVILLTLKGDLDVSKLHPPLPDLRLAPQEVLAQLQARDYDALVDLSETGNIDGSYARISALISAKESLFRTRRAPRRLAFWAPGDLAFGTCRMFEQMAQDRLSPDILVTRDQSEAIAHIGRREHSLERLKRALTDDHPPRGAGGPKQEALAS
ncbi:hypothetical protein [Aliiroseovarius crassostreae]|uniref:hypothetical protein n=1 Tax=Aliiroseovarius crassostreae TaxID=154981 RepID=UPI003C7A865F